MVTPLCKIHRGFAEYNEKNLSGVSYTAKGRLHGVFYTVESLFGGVRYTGEAIAKKMKATTAFKGTILQKADQNLTLLSHSMMNMNLKLFKVGSCKSTPQCILHRRNDFIFEYLREYSAKIKIIPVYL